MKQCKAFQQIFVADMLKIVKYCRMCRLSLQPCTDHFAVNGCFCWVT